MHNNDERTMAMKRDDEMRLREAAGVCIRYQTSEDIRAAFDEWHTRDIDPRELARGPWADRLSFDALAPLQPLAILHPTAWPFGDAGDAWAAYLSSLARTAGQKLYVTQDEGTRFYFVTMKPWPHPTRYEGEVLPTGEWVFISFS